MATSIEMCPKCQKLQNMRISISLIKKIDDIGNKKDILTKIYHCDVCNIFVKSEIADDVENYNIDNLQKCD